MVQRAEDEAFEASVLHEDSVGQALLALEGHRLEDKQRRKKFDF